MYLFQYCATIDLQQERQQVRCELVQRLRVVLQEARTQALLLFSCAASLLTPLAVCAFSPSPIKTIHTMVIFVNTKRQLVCCAQGPLCS